MDFELGLAKLHWKEIPMNELQGACVRAQMESGNFPATVPFVKKMWEKIKIEKKGLIRIRWNT